MILPSFGMLSGSDGGVDHLSGSHGGGQHGDHAMSPALLVPVISHFPLRGEDGHS
jgi:hypothetical protein